MKLLKEKTIVSSITLVSSLAAYFYAKSLSKDAMPYMMVGGFLGALVGETVAIIVLQDKKDAPTDKKISKEQQEDKSIKEDAD
jgi:hypothetical protein